MLKRFQICLIILAGFTRAYCQIPAAYYDAANGLTCQPLKTALKNIVSTNTQALSYTPGLWNAYAYTDMHMNDANTTSIIWDMYTDLPSGNIYSDGTAEIEFIYGVNQDNGTGGTSEGQKYNREHSFPQSWFANASPMVSDLHHIFPTDKKVNSIRADYPYGYVLKSNPGAPLFYKSKNGSYRGNPTAALGYNGTVFEPVDEYKGDLARAYFYMAVRYEDQINNWWSNSNANEILLSPADQPDAATRLLQVFDNWQLKLLFQWHIADAVSQKETQRNNSIYYQDITDGAGTVRQGNRNPFIDHPEYVALIWQCTGLLPVTITSFNGTRHDDAVELKWYATYETNFRTYEIERSIDGMNFQKIGEIAGGNNGNYYFTDEQLPLKAVIYYRLKMIDADGSFRYSSIVAVRLNNNFSNAIVYPNPTKEKLNILLSGALTSESNIYITDVTGRVIYTEVATAGTLNILLNVQHLSPGRYFVKIRNRESVINQSFVVIK